jgi:hypothetical protein
MLTEKGTGKPRGIAFVELLFDADWKAPEGAMGDFIPDQRLAVALTKHHTLLAGRRINVEKTAGGSGSSGKRKAVIEEMRNEQKGTHKTRITGLLSKVSEEYGGEFTGVLKPDMFDDRATDFLTWFDDRVAGLAVREFADAWYGGKVNNCNAFLMGILKRYRVTDGENDAYKIGDTFKKQKTDGGFDTSWGNGASGGGGDDGGGEPELNAQQRRLAKRAAKRAAFEAAAAESGGDGAGSAGSAGAGGEKRKASGGEKIALEGKGEVNAQERRLAKREAKRLKLAAEEAPSSIAPAPASSPAPAPASKSAATSTPAGDGGMNAQERRLAKREAKRVAAEAAAGGASSTPSTGPKTPGGTSIKERLTQIEGLKSAGLISDVEYSEKRQAILASI